MADWPVVLLVLCVLCVILDYASVLTAAVNVSVKMEMIKVVPRLRFLKKEALKSGKIKLDKVRSEVHSTATRLQDGVDYMDESDWTTWTNVNHESFSWSHFESVECGLRNVLGVKPMVVRTRYKHDNPIYWCKIITLISSVLFREGRFVDIRPDGRPFSIPFLKFVSRILYKFPVIVPELFDQNMTEREKLVNDITFITHFVKTKIQPCLTNGPPRPTQCHNDSVFVSSSELTHLWTHNQQRAIDIINNNGTPTTHVSCPINIEDIEAEYVNKTTRTLDTLPPPPWEPTVVIEEPAWLPSTEPVTHDEVEHVIKTLPSKKAPGADGVTYEVIRQKCKQLIPLLTMIFNVCLQLCRVPQEWKHGIITLIPKTTHFSESLDDYRPISALLTFYKLFMKIIQGRVMPWIVNTQRLSLYQKGSMPRAGLHEHVFCVKTNISDFLHAGGQLYIGFVDLKDAFGSIDHAHMLRELQSIGLPDMFLRLTQDIYRNSTFQVKTERGITVPITRGKGIIQGCPYSVLAFEVGIDKWLRWVDVTSIPRAPNPPIQGFVDDVITMSKNNYTFAGMFDKTEQFIDATGMAAKQRKCAIMTGKRSGNNWKEGNTVSISVQNETIPVFERDQTYRYLGFDNNISNTAEKEQIKDIMSKFKDTLAKINACLLPNSAKVQAINVMCISRLNFYFPNMSFPECVLQECEDMLVDAIRSWFDLNKSSTRSFMFTPKCKGGLGIPQPHALYYASRLSFILSVLNSDDLCVRQCARDSLALHMLKRKVPPAAVGQASFAGYSVVNDKLDKNSKVNWPRSFWVHIFEMCQRKGICLRMRGDIYVFEMSSNDGTTCIVESPSGFKLFYKEKCQNEQLDYWTSLASQGRYIRETTDIDHSLSMHVFDNHNVEDKIRNFIMKCRLQLLPCNSLLSLYYPNVHTKRCKNCNHPSETVSHILNGCGLFRKWYSDRHNRIANLIANKIAAYNADCQILCDKVIKPTMFGSDVDTFEFTHTRPDIVVIDNSNRAVTINEIAIPYDCHIHDCFKTKYDKYTPLAQAIGSLGYDVQTVILLIGSMGSVHNKFLKGLMKNNLNMHEAKYLARYCSVSAQIGSFRIWKKRCSHLDV